ncbi:MAG TPA: hypothetical protein ENI62_10705 [Gammaproteobacteria bacterium]|nr:hypothetical protein [Gammaproteobacteria bacterium]
MNILQTLKYTSFFLAFLVAGCGGSGSTSGTGTDSSTTYNGTITQVYIPDAAGRQELNSAVATCSFSGDVTAHINDDGSVTITNSNMGGQNSATCAILSEIYNASFSGSANGTSYQATASASGPHTSMNGQISGTYDASTITGTGSGTITATTPAGVTVNFSASFSFQATVI